MPFLQITRTQQRSRDLSGKSYASNVSGMLRRLKIAINERILGEIHRRKLTRLKRVFRIVRLYIDVLERTPFL